jgi:Leucine-rich repeat (LRR) protein
MKSVLGVMVISLLLASFFIGCEKDEPNPIVQIPDSNFLNALIELGVDTNGDGIISTAEAEAVISLDVSDNSISDMTGIEKFVNLDTLKCYSNQLTSLDFSNNTALIDLWCSGNQLTTLDVSNNAALKHLVCTDNQLTSLIFSDNNALNYLFCDNNQLSTLDISNNTALERLSLSQMPNLGQVCVWEMPFPPDGVEVNTTGSPNVYFTLDCTL